LARQEGTPLTFGRADAHIRNVLFLANGFGHIGLFRPIELVVNELEAIPHLDLQLLVEIDDADQVIRPWHHGDHARLRG